MAPMLSTVLHVEDDPVLSELVEVQFQHFGFLGTVVMVETVEKAEEALEARARDGGTFELIISDMNLPDGSGLDVVKFVRASLVWQHTPILILSGDLDPKKVGRAYALGANAYVNKSPEGRSLDDVLRTLYDQWTSDVVLPPGPNRITRLIGRALAIRARHAQIYQRLAEEFADNRSEAAFWLSRALAESNLTNLLVFLQQQSTDRDLPPDMIDEMSAMQDALEALLMDVERAFAQPSIARSNAYGHIVDLLSKIDVDAVARSISYLFPVMPTAMTALRDFLIGTVDDVTAWIDLHSLDPSMRARTANLRAKTEPLVVSVH